MTNLDNNMLAYIKSYTSRNGYPPTYAEIRDECGFGSVSTVHTHLNTLEQAGLIRRDHTRARTVVVIEGAAA